MHLRHGAQHIIIVIFVINIIRIGIEDSSQVDQVYASDGVKKPFLNSKFQVACRL